MCLENQTDRNRHTGTDREYAEKQRSVRERSVCAHPIDTQTEREVCVWRETGRETDRQTDRERETQRERGR